jgi:hypothetical protein
MIYNFSRSEIFSVAADSLMKAAEREPYDVFVRSYGFLGPQPCPFCGEIPKRFYYETTWTIGNEPGGKEDAWKDTHLLLCPRCVWFRGSSHYMTGNGDIYATQYYSSYQKSDADISTLPLARLEQHLARQWADWKELTPGQAENLVAGVFAEHLDAQVHYTTDGVYSPDGGIDFVLVETNTGLEYAFQVKRRLTADPERIQPIREFIGAMAVQGYDRGYYVTFAPRMTKAAQQEVKRGQTQLLKHGLSIDVIDGTQLRDLLRNSRRAHVREHILLAGLPDFAPPSSEVWYEIPLETDSLTVPKQLLAGRPVALNEMLTAL